VIGKSRGGMTVEILAFVDELGNLVPFTLMPRQRGEIIGARKLIEGLSLGALLADKAYDADHFRDHLKSNGVEAVIRARKKRRNPANHDAEIYKWRHLLENFFQKLKELRQISLRACKTDTGFSAMINLAATVIRSW
jgi:transposase